MKTLKVLLLFFFLFCNCIFTLYAQDHNDRIEILLESYNGKTKDETGSAGEKGVPIKRSIQLQSAYAYLYNNVVSIDFTEAFSTAIITITNEATGETVYSETCSNPSNLNINLGGESSGSYLVEIEADDSYLTGSFSL